MDESYVTRPLFVSFVAWILGTHALILPFIAFLTFGPNSTGIFTFDGEEYRVAEHGVWLALFMTGYWLLAVTVAFGFYRRLSWSRYVLMAPLIGQTVFSIFEYGIGGGTFIVVAMVAGITWYFFGKENVKKYFEVAR
jgi:hypothetical protein